jgi:hypothetical protein
MSTIVTRLAKGSSLSYQELDDNFSNLNTDKLEDITNESIGDLSDVDIATISNGQVLAWNASSNKIEAVTPSAGVDTLSALTDVNVSAPPTDGYVLTWDQTAGFWVDEALPASGIGNVVEDTTPQLGGNLDLNGNQIVSLSSAVVISADGYIELDTTVTSSNKTIYIGNNNAEAIKIQHSFWPSTAGTANYFLKTDGAGNTSWALPTAGLSDVVADTTPQLGGNLDVNGNSIVSVSNGNITLAPNGTGKVVANNLNYRETVHSLGTTSGTIAPNVTNGNVQSITLNGNITFNGFTSPVAGQSVTLIINTGGTNRTLTSTMKFANADKTLSTTNTTDIISVYYDGTNYWASLSKGFA